MAITRKPRPGPPASPPPAQSDAKAENELREKDRNRNNTKTPPNRKRGSRGGRATNARPQPVRPSASALLAQLPYIRATAIACRVPLREVDEVVSACLLAAWTAIQRGDFRVHAWVDPTEALARWVYGIAWRLSAHERGRVRHRHEVLVEDPWALAAELGLEPAVEPEGQFRARAALRALNQLPPEDRRLLLDVAAGATTNELAGPLGVSTRAVLLRIERAREALAALIRDVI